MMIGLNMSFRGGSGVDFDWPLGEDTERFHFSVDAVRYFGFKAVFPGGGR